MTRTRRQPPPPVEDPADAKLRKGKEPMERTVQQNLEFARRLKSNQRRSMVVERGLNFKDLKGISFLIDVDHPRWRTYCTIRNQCNKTVVQEFYATMSLQHFLEGGSVRVRGQNVGFNAKDINEWWRLRAILIRQIDISPTEFISSTTSIWPTKLRDTESSTWNTLNMFVQSQLDFKSTFWPTFFCYSLFPSHHRHNVTLGPAILLYLMKKNLLFDCGTIALKRITVAEPMLDWANDLTTMVRDLTIEFRAFRDSFGEDRTYNRRTPQFLRKRTRTQGLSFRANGADDPEPDLAVSPMHHLYSPIPDPTFDPAAEFQDMSLFSHMVLISYPTPIRST
ncbi:hypothetical protein Dsin_029242 [Dipteronia sinensis]|uniref:Putative plant transposon protein domain-containing protein n=1 Tax=Dipteronia sinensis TaxID=43782 RepID=A0AAD9ZTP7_9ROSI|nr:hypothetical protein Dsin_029242 [Dipteronia sinensis]